MRQWRLGEGGWRRLIVALHHAGSSHRQYFIDIRAGGLARANGGGRPAPGGGRAIGAEVKPR